MHSTRRRLGVVLGAIIASALGALPAAAMPADPATPRVEWTVPELTVGYGDGVEAGLRFPGLGDACAEAAACAVELSARDGTFAPGPPEGLHPEAPEAPDEEWSVSWGLEAGTPAIRAGAHVVDAALRLPDGAVVRSTTPLRITVEPATLSIAVQVTTDPGDRSGAVIAAQLEGEYLSIVNDDRVTTPLLTPAGTWVVTAVDATGATVFADERAVAAGGPVAATWYWSSVPADAAFSVSASFRPSGSYAQNLTVLQNGSTAHASPEAAAAPLVEIEPPTEAQPTVADSVSIPTGAVVLAVLTALALLTTAIVLAVRLEHRVARTTGAATAAAGVPRA